MSQALAKSGWWGRGGGRMACPQTCPTVMSARPTVRSARQALAAPWPPSKPAAAATARSPCAGRWCRLHAFPPGAEGGPDPHLIVDKTGFVDTGFTCRFGHDGETLIVTGPPGAIVTVGGYRIRPRELETQVAAIDPDATVVALPGGILAQRLAGGASDNAFVSSQLL